MSKVSAHWVPCPAPAKGLDAAAVHLWRVRATAGEGAELPESDRTEVARLAREGDRARARAARAALRNLAGAYLGREPNTLEFARRETGKPRLVAPGEPPLRFNLAHSGGWVLLGFTLRGEIGVDVEAVRDVAGLDRISAREFTARERAAFAAAGAGRVAVFFRCWALKEAWLKARGDGIPWGPSRIDVSGVEPHAWSVVQGWSLRDVELTPGYAAAVAVEGTGSPPAPMCFEWIPPA